MSIKRIGKTKIYGCDACGFETEPLGATEHVPLGWVSVNQKDSGAGWTTQQWLTLHFICPGCSGHFKKRIEEMLKDVQDKCAELGVVKGRCFASELRGTSLADIREPGGQSKSPR